MIAATELPYSNDALSPHISAETFEYHYGKHYKAYIDKVNAQIAGTAYAEKSLEEIVKAAEGGLFNNAAQVYNHAFYWNCLSPNGGGEPDAQKHGEVVKAIESSFGSYKDFREAFTQAAITNFGSGWTWLVKGEGGKVAIESTSNAGTPVTAGQTSLLTIDVWEHAYYIDYRNARPKYCEAFWNIVNWDFIAKNLSAG